MPRTRILLAGWLALFTALGCLLTPSSAQAKDREWVNEEQNVLVRLPTSVKTWDWLPHNPAWAKAGIIKGARRAVETLKNGKAADGHGALMHITVTNADKDMTVDGLAENSDVRDFLLKRFRGTEGDVEVDQITIEADGKFEQPALVLRTEGKALNLKRKEAPCKGILVATIARGKLAMMRLYAWTTEYDAEGLGVDIDLMEGEALGLLTAKEKKGKGEQAPPKKPEDDDKDDEAKEEEGKEETLEFRAQRWRMTKHKKVTRVEITEEEKADYLVFKSAGSDRGGGYSFYIYAPPNARYIDGVQAPAPDLKSFMGPRWWQNFNNNHPKGELATYKWPKKPQTKGARTFLTLPYMEDEKNRQVVFDPDDKRPIEVDISDMIKKFKFVEKPRRGNVGAKGKVSEPLRGSMSGKRPTGGYTGFETVYRFAFRNREHSYRIFVVFYGMGYKKWGEAIRLTLESIEFGIKFKD